jgi:hypothetical protein
MIEKVQFRLGGHFFFHRQGDEEVEALVFVSGCPRACAGQELNREESPCYSITGEGGYEALIDWLTAVSKKGDSK